MKALFVELPPFERKRATYLEDDSFREFQNTLLANPDAGDVIQGTGGLRKVRYTDSRRGKGKRGGIRVIFFWWEAGCQFWLFTLFDKDEADDLTAEQRKILKALLKTELTLRSTR